MNYLLSFCFLFLTLNMSAQKIQISPDSQFKLPNGNLINFKKYKLLSVKGIYSIDKKVEGSEDVFVLRKNSEEIRKQILEKNKKRSDKTHGVIFKNEAGEIISYYDYITLENTGEWIGRGKKDPETGKLSMQLRKPNKIDILRKEHNEWRKKIIGTPAPKFEIYDMNKKLINSENTQGKVVFLNFWFTRCAPCIKEIPNLNKIYQKYKNHPEVVFISVCKDDEEKTLKFTEKHPIDMPISVISQKSIDAFNVFGYPTNIIIDKNGNYKKYEHMINENFEKYIQEALSL